MGGISMWQLIILLAPVVFAYLAYRSMRKGAGLERPLRFLTWSFLASIASTVFFAAWAGQLGTDNAEMTATGAIAALALLWVMLTAGLVFWIALGMLARRQGRSPIVWVGLSIITSPIGPLVSYFWMRSLTKKAMSA